MTGQSSHPPMQGDREGLPGRSPYTLQSFFSYKSFVSIRAIRGLQVCICKSSPYAGGPRGSPYLIITFLPPQIYIPFCVGFCISL